MTRDDVIRWAREAGLNTWHAYPPSRVVEQWRCFAALVAAAEREACAQVCAGEEARALYNFDNDLEANRPFWNGGSQIATSCETSIRARSTP